MLSRALIGAVVLVSAGNVSAQDNTALKPNVELIASSIDSALPLYWGTQTVNVVAEVNDGDAVDPNWRMRFEAEIGPASALFEPAPEASASLAPFVVLIETLPADATRTLYGTATATYAAGSWTVEVNAENPPTGLGKPVDLFDRPTVVAGTEGLEAAKTRILEAEQLAGEIAAERARREAAIEEEISALETRRVEALEELEQAHAAALARIETRQQAAQTELDAASQALRTDIEAALDEIEAEKSRALSEARSVAEQTVARMQRELQSIETRKSEALAQAGDLAEGILADMKRSLRQVEQDRTAALSEARAEAQTMRAELAAELEAQRTALEADLAKAKGRLEELAEGSVEAMRIEAQTEAFAAEAEALAALEEAETARGERLAALEAARAKTVRDAASARKESLKALRETLQSDDAMVRRTAFREAFASGNPVLQQAAFTAMIADDTLLPVRMRERGGSDAENGEWLRRNLEFDWLEDSTGNFKVYWRGPNGSITGRGTITGSRVQSTVGRDCTFALTFTKTGEELAGDMTCEENSYDIRMALM